MLVLEWTDPPFGPGHWVPDLVEAAGATPLCARPGERSVQLEWEEITAEDADAIVISPCGFHLDAASDVATSMLSDHRLPQGAAVWGIDADAVVVRPGPRLVDGIEAIASIAHPGALPAQPDRVRFVGTTSAKTKPSRSTT
jgi:iron complex transport system substrate-binding protein